MSEASEGIQHIGSQEELDKYLNESGDKLVVLMFYAHWCGPSLFIAPFYEELANENTDCVFLRLNTNKASELADSLGVSQIPTFYFYVKGAKLDQLIGANEHKLRDHFAKNKS
ncbi:Thioredoxin 1 [Oopsacas minuta]|uniref:Thioredoxin n=1 Tax=Oopsacas minuta TaxID=111878 RepID=A0AAV7JXF6_9METZ|nr:Thioredoxin 1 [Oopsacas minuta]